MPILSKGNKVTLILDNGNRVVFPPDFEMIHDTEGHVLPKNEAFLMRLPGDDLLPPEKTPWDVRDYYQEEPMVLRELPRIPRKFYQHRNRVIRIFYTRYGSSISGNRVHDYKEKVPLFFDPKQQVFRLVFPDSCVWNWRGFVYP